MWRVMGGGATARPSRGRGGFPAHRTCQRGGRSVASSLCRAGYDNSQPAPNRFESRPVASESRRGGSGSRPGASGSGTGGPVVSLLAPREEAYIPTARTGTLPGVQVASSSPLLKSLSASPAVGRASPTHGGQALGVRRPGVCARTPRIPPLRGTAKPSQGH